MCASSSCRSTLSPQLILAGPIIVLLVLLLPAEYILIKQLRDWAGRLPRALSVVFRWAMST